MKWRGVDVADLPDLELSLAFDAACRILAELRDELQRRGAFKKKARRKT